MCFLKNGGEQVCRFFSYVNINRYGAGPCPRWWEVSIGECSNVGETSFPRPREATGRESRVIRKRGYVDGAITELLLCPLEMLPLGFPKVA